MSIKIELKVKLDVFMYEVVQSALPLFLENLLQMCLTELLQC